MLFCLTVGEQHLTVTTFQRLSTTYWNKLQCSIPCASDDQCFGYLVTLAPSQQCKKITDTDVANVCTENPLSACYRKNRMSTMEPGTAETTTMNQLTTTEATTMNQLTTEATTTKQLTTTEATTLKQMKTTEATTKNQPTTTEATTIKLTTLELTTKSPTDCVETILKLSDNDVWISFKSSNILAKYYANVADILTDARIETKIKSSYYPDLPSDVSAAYYIEDSGEKYLFVFDGESQTNGINIIIKYFKLRI